MRGRMSVRRVLRKVWTEVEFRRSWPEGGSEAE